MVASADWFRVAKWAAAGGAAGLVVYWLSASKGEETAPPPVAPPTPAPATLRALADANARWPGRNKASDGILGDWAHQQRKSDHNVGNAVDITHDPSGCSGDVISEAAIRDPRVSYVIWNNRIWNGEWHPYTGPNPHTSHVHISIKASAREDVRPWPWASGAVA